MKWPSLSLLLSGVFLTYITYSIYTLSLLFVPPPCIEGQVCLTSFLNTKPQLGLHMYVSTMSRPIQKELTHVYSERIFNYGEAHDIQVALPIPRKTRDNGTLFLHLLVTPHTDKHGDTYTEVIKNPATVYTRIKMTQYIVPEIAAFNLLGDEKASKNDERLIKPVSHLKSQVTFTMIIDNIKLPAHNLPLELARDIRKSMKRRDKDSFLQIRSITRDGMFLPIVNYDFLQTRHRDLVKILPKIETMNVTVHYTPISIGKLRLILHVEAAMQGLKGLGFSDKDVDEVKGIFADTNVYLLGGTIFIAAIHLLFDFLAFKSDVNFWRGKNNLAGLSVRTVVWRAFSQAVIFLYLLDEHSSMLVLIPAGIGTIIELWKSKKILRAEFVTNQGWLPRIKFGKIESSSAEERTRKFDAESMKYLSYLLYPLVVGGAVYSLLYQPHRSWYSWSINSLVNGVYAFGFLFMLPQLFVNYKLKSVAHLPWRAFMYKAFNTFIDDIFAFIITMPTAHRVACFRDDAVFLVYLYQRWLYPVDKSRRDDTVSMDETPTEYKMYDKKKN